MKSILSLTLLISCLWNKINVLGNNYNKVYIWTVDSKDGPKLKPDLYTTIDYAIYSVRSGNYLNGRDSTNKAKAQLTSWQDKDDSLLWRIERMKYTNGQFYYTLKCRSNGNYLCFFYDNNDKVYVKSYESAWSVSNCWWKFELTDPFDPAIVNYPNVAIKFYDPARKSNWDGWLDGRSKDSDPILTNRDPTFDKYLQWVFIPKSAPDSSSCDSLTSNPSNPEIYSPQNLVIYRQDTYPHTNEGSVSRLILTNEQKLTISAENTFTRISGEEMTYGFKVAMNVGWSAGDSGGLQGGIEGEYHMDWTRYSSIETTKTEIHEEEITIPSTEIECPARTTCERQIIQYAPPSSQVTVTMTSICDDKKYITEGRISVNGPVLVMYKDTMAPMDCPYYTTDYGNIGTGYLPFCDTCLDNKECKICRDYYVLSIEDGQCITPHVCEGICGGQVKGDGVDGLNNETPFSGAWCDIIDIETYNTAKCAQETGRNL